MKSRFDVWLESVGHTVASYAAARHDADLRGVFVELPIDGKSVLVTDAYWKWVNLMYAEWNASLEYGEGEFDAWLNARYGGGP